MSIPWETVLPGLRALLCDLGGLQTDDQNKRRSFTDPKQQARVLINVDNEEGIGIDDRRITDTKDPKPHPNLIFTQNGHRRVMLTVRVESHRHDDDRFAFNTASKIRTGLNFPSSLERLRALNIAIIRKGQAADVSNVIVDQRITSVAVLPLELNVGICTADPVKAYSIEAVDNPVDHRDTVIAVDRTS
jgi:hypothetical protein